MAEKATKAQTLQRVDEVYRMLLDGRDTADILEIISEKYGVCEKTAAYYITKANKDLKRLTNQSKQEHLEYVLSNLKQLAIEAYREKNYNCTLGCFSQIAKITGLEKLVIEMPKDDIPDVGEEEVLAKLESESAVH